MNECSEFVSDNVVNLSNRNLTEAEISWLSKGLKFCVTPRELDWCAIQKDLREFGPKLKCRVYFLNKVEDYEEQKSLDRFKEKLAWVPKEVEPEIDLYLSVLEERVCLINERGRNFSNISVAEREALGNLKRYRDIVIKEADKGSAVVIWGREDYCKEVFDQLRDSDVYERILNDLLDQVSSLVAQSLDLLMKEGHINEKNRKYLLNPRPRLGRFYLLPKIHKTLEKVPGRPIISNCGTATERTSEVLDFYI